MTESSTPARALSSHNTRASPPTYPSLDLTGMSAIEVIRACRTHPLTGEYDPNIRRSDDGTQAVEIIGRKPPVLVAHTIRDAVRNAFWHRDLRRHVELPAAIVKGELGQYTPGQIAGAKHALGIKSAKQDGTWWWFPHPSWPRPEMIPSTTVLIRRVGDENDEGGWMLESDLEPWGYNWR